MFFDHTTAWTLLPIPAAVFFLHRLYNYISHTLSLPQVAAPPLPSYIWGHVVDLRRAPVGTRFNVWMKQYGNTYKLREPLMEPVLILGDPKGITHVLTTKVSNYPRPNIDNYVLELWFGRSILVVNGEEHSKMRRQLNVAFTPQSVKEVSSILFDLAYRLRGKWEEKIGSETDAATFDIAAYFHTFALDAISMTMFAHNLSASEGTVTTLLHNITNGPATDSPMALLMGIFIGAYPQLLRALPNPMTNWANKLRTELGKVAKEVWDGQEEAGTDSKMIQALKKVDKDGEVTSQDEAVAQIIALLFAGSETVANMMGELFYELAHRPKIQDKLRAELLHFQQVHGREPTHDDLLASANTLPYLDAVTRETIRCKAVLMDISRCAAEDDVIPLSKPLAHSGVTQLKVKAGTNISIPIRDGVNVDPEIWGRDAEVFRPERWIEEGGIPETAKAVHALGNVLTFGDGPRICLGRNFAYAEFKIVASTIISKFAFAPDGSKIDFYHLGGNTVKPKIRGREVEGVQLPLSVRRL